MECPVCLETIRTPYQLKSCSHQICMKCYRSMREKHYPLVVETVSCFVVKCPLCRKKEDIPIDPSKYPVEYKQHLELLMTYNDGDAWYTYQEDYVKPIVRPIKYHKIVHRNRQTHQKY